MFEIKSWFELDQILINLVQSYHNYLHPFQNGTEHQIFSKLMFKQFQKYIIKFDRDNSIERDLIQSSSILVQSNSDQIINLNEFDKLLNFIDQIDLSQSDREIYLCFDPQLGFDRDSDQKSLDSLFIIRCGLNLTLVQFYIESIIKYRRIIYYGSNQTILDLIGSNISNYLNSIS